MNIDFTTEELELLASFVCERYDMLWEGINDPRVTSKEYKRGSRKAADSIESLNNKLRPHFVKGKHN